MIALLDVNVLVALAWPNHVHHAAARIWFHSQRESGWATCPTTENGFIRVSSNRVITPESRSPEEAGVLLRRLMTFGRHEFWPEDVSLLDEKWVQLRKIRVHRQVTDAYLLSLALNRGGRLATFDRGIIPLAPANLDVTRVLDLVPFGQ